MKSFLQFLLETTTKPLKTPRGTRIGRNTKYGVGKTMGDNTWVHKNYMNMVVPKDILYKAIKRLPDTFQYNTIKYNKIKNTVRFEEGKNFDSAREPFAGVFIEVSPNGTLRHGGSESIYHHKWQWVLDDYAGFDVQKSYDWSKYYLEQLKIVALGGSQEVWDMQLAKAGYNDNV